MTGKRLIEEAFPLKKVSEDSRHEKNVRHGHISTLHIWPARRPLAACRAALIATLVPDPGDEHSREELCKKIESITHWGEENGQALGFFRDEIRLAYGGRAPRVLDPFAGGGAIPLEAMRLGCDVTANDYNPVAWFILKCTLEFPQRLAGKTWPLPKGPCNTPSTRPGRAPQLRLPEIEHVSEVGDLAAHVLHWGEWVLRHARDELASLYPTVKDQPTVAYLWARTVPCPDPDCGAAVPLLKTLWLCRKNEKRRALRLAVDPTERRVRFEIWSPGSQDEVPGGTMAGAKCRCPVCGVQITPKYLKECGQRGKMGAQMTAVVIDTGRGKEYRQPTPEEQEAADGAADFLQEAAKLIPHGIPSEPQQMNPRTLIVQLYGLGTWADLFTQRQLAALITFVNWTRACRLEIRRCGYPKEWEEAVAGYLAIAVDRLADRGGSSLSHWDVGSEGVVNTFQRFALPINWDYSEANPLTDSGGSYASQLGWIVRYVAHALMAAGKTPPDVLQQSATNPWAGSYDVVVTDPPYYDAIPYGDLSDFFYVWLRRSIGDHYPDVFGRPTVDKDDELALRLPHKDIPCEHTPEWYRQRMTLAFQRICEVLTSDGRLVTVFAHKDPHAWQSLVEAMIGVGFTITASWPIETEMGNRPRAQESAALASSIWLVCRKRPSDAGIGRYSVVRRTMQERVTERLRYFWDTGISGPDFVWAAVGPALESYSSYEEVRRLDGSPFTVGEFLREVRRLVADFCLGRILQGRSTEGLDETTRYYLMHRSYFGLEPAPMGECILLSQGYGLEINDLRSQAGLLLGAEGSDLRLGRWDERKRDGLGETSTGGGLPLVDALHRLMHLWESGDLDHLNAYVTQKGLRENELFWAVAQAVLEMAKPGSRERTLIEALVAWGRGKASANGARQERLPGTGV